jgi:SAM-dependent methyltransferase
MGDFFDMLCCPACQGDLQRDPAARELHCPACRFDFPIVDGIPVLFPCDVKEEMGELFNRYWDSEERAASYAKRGEAGETKDVLSRYIDRSEIHGVTHYFRDEHLGVVLDAGCGNGLFLESLPPRTVRVGLDASLNLLRATARAQRADFLVCGELEHLPFKSECFDTVMSCRVLQHIRQQSQAVHEMARVLRPGGDMILELYNSWNLKTIYKQIRMSPRLRRLFNAPFRAIFRSMSPFSDWGLSYDNYNSWFEVKTWMLHAHLGAFRGRGVGFGHHKYLLAPFYIHGAMKKHAPGLLAKYYDWCFAFEKRFGALIPLRYGMEKFSIAGTKGA